MVYHCKDSNFWKWFFPIWTSKHYPSTSHMYYYADIAQDAMSYDSEYQNDKMALHTYTQLKVSCFIRG